MKRLLFLLALVCVSTYGQNGQGQNTARMLSGTNVVTLCPYTVQATDQTKLLVFNSASACAVNLPTATTLNFGAGAIFSVKNQGPGAVTITPTSGTISGSPSLSLTTGQGADIYSDGINYQTQSGAGVGGGGGGSPAGSNFQAQVYSSGSLGFTPCLNVSAPSSGSAIANLDCDTHNAGPNPWIDVTRYGVRACAPGSTPCALGITAAVASGNPVITLSSASTFVNGDGVTIQAAGPAPSMTTPGAPTVTPSIANVLTGTRMVSNGPSGSTTYNYEIFAEDQHGGLTAVSSVGTTTTGAATLGTNSVNITSCARSNVTVTCTTSSAHGYATGTNPQIIYIQSASDSTYDGWYTTSNVADNTHFSFISSQDTRTGATSSSTGGTVTWWNCNHITWTRVTGAYRYWIAGRSGGSLTTIGVSWPENSFSSGIAGSPITEGVNSWDDFGSTMMGNLVLPWWIPSTPRVSATNDNLTTTILSGGGSTSVTLATAPSASFPSGNIVLDAVPGIIAARNAASPFATGLPIYFPATSSGTNAAYVVNSFLDLTTTRTSILINGNLQLNDTVEFPTYSKITGVQTVSSNSSFPYDSLPSIIINAAYPGIHIIDGTPFRMEGVSLNSANGSANNNLFVVQDFGGANPGSFYKRVEFITGGGNDLMGIGLLVRGVPGQLSAQLTMEDVLFLPGASTAQGVSATPSLLCADCGGFINKSIQGSHRGFYMGMDGTGFGFRSDSLYFQGSATPAITFASADGNSSPPPANQIVFNGQATMDSSGNPLIWMAPGSTATTLLLDKEGVTATGTNNINGVHPSLIWGKVPSGSSTDFAGAFSTCTDDGLFVTPVNACANMATFLSAGQIATVPSYSIFVGQLPIAAPTASVVSGGSLTIGAHNFQVAPIWLNGGVGNPSAVSNTVTTTSGNQSVTVTWTPVPGGCEGYMFIRDGGSVAVPSTYIHGCNTATFTDTGYGGGGTLPGTAGGSSTMLMPGTQGISSGGPVNAPSVALYQGTTNNTHSLVSSGVTANRTATFPDLTGYVPLSTTNPLSAKTGQTLVSSNAANPDYLSPGIQDGNSGSPVTSTPYTIQCDSSTTLIDRAHILRFQSGAAAVTVPLSTATGCTAGFVVSVVDDGAGTLTFSRTSPDTFSVFSGSSNTDSATSFTLTNGQHATLTQGASGIWEVRIVAGGAGVTSSIFYAASNCSGLANCVTWVDDDSTDNCGTATTSWLSSINSYAGAGESHVYIQGSGSGKAYKFASCNLAFTGPSGTGGQAGSVNIRSEATIDCAQSSGNCIQFGSSSCTGIYTTGCHDVTWRGGTIVGCASLGTACFEWESNLYIGILDDVNFVNTGAGNSTLGTCTNYSIQLDNSVGGGEISRNRYYGSVKGQCFSKNLNNGNQGSNTILFSKNIISHTVSTTCGGIAHSDASSHSMIIGNEIYGFAANILLESLVGDGGWTITGNNFDYASCLIPSSSGGAIQWGGSNTVGPVAITGNNSQTSPFIGPLPSVSTALLNGWTVTGNTAGDPAIGGNQTLISGSTTVTQCAPITASSQSPCTIGANPGFNLASYPGWLSLSGNYGHVFSGALSANLSSANINNSTTFVAGTYEVFCQAVLTRAATSSSTMPLCTVSWTDLLTSTTQNANVTSTSGANTVGTQSQGRVYISAASATAISVSTSGYASTGATSMQYDVFADIIKVF